MSLNFLNLDARTRHFMAAEIERDVKGGSIYVSSRLSATGKDDYVRLLSEGSCPWWWCSWMVAEPFAKRALPVAL